MRLTQNSIRSPPGFHPKYLKLCSEDEQSFYGFGTTWGKWFNDKIFILGWSNPLSEHISIYISIFSLLYLRVLPQWQLCIFFFSESDGIQLFLLYHGHNTSRRCSDVLKQYICQDFVLQTLLCVELISFPSHPKPPVLIPKRHFRAIRWLKPLICRLMQLLGERDREKERLSVCELTASLRLSASVRQQHIY